MADLLIDLRVLLVGIPLTLISGVRALRQQANAYIEEQAWWGEE